MVVMFGLMRVATLVFMTLSGNFRGSRRCNDGRFLLFRSSDAAATLPVNQGGSNVPVSATASHLPR
jgi:hypothetical protein